MADVLDGLDVAEEVAAPQAPEVPETPETPEAARDEKGRFAPKEADKAPEKPAEKPPEKEVRQIPLAAHLEERNKLRSEIDAERAARKALEERLAKLENPPKPPAPEPDYVEDPKGYVDAKVTRALEQLNAEKIAPIAEKVEQSGKTAEQAQQEAGFQRFMGDLASTEQVFVKDKPDYYDALGHLRNIRANELQIAHPEATQEQIANAIRSEELQLAAHLMRQGRNPHEVAYQVAKVRGYAPKAALPQVPAPKQLPPDQTLGAGAGGAEVEEEVIDPFEGAFKEMFARKRA